MEKDTPKHAVQQGIAYKTVNGHLTRNYVVLGGQRTYVFGAKPGDELTKSEARRLATAPKAAEPVENSSED